MSSFVGFFGLVALLGNGREGIQNVGATDEL